MPKESQGATTGFESELWQAANPALKDVLPKDYARPVLDKQRLGQLIDLVSNIAVGTAEARSKDVLGRVYEYFLSQFASAEGKRGGEFYTPRCVVKLLVEMIEPYQGRVYDPCCGSSGMFVQSVEFIQAHATGNGNGGTPPPGTRRDISIYGQEANYTTWRLAKMNLAIRGIEGQIAQGDGFCKAVTLEEIRKHDHILTPGRYVGAKPREENGEPFEDKMHRLTAQWREQQVESAKLDAQIESNLVSLGFGPEDEG